MKKLKYLIISLVLILFTTPVSALEEKTDFYVDANSDIRLEENVSGSSLLAGNNVEVNSKIKGIGFLFGNNINVNNSVDYIITAGNNIIIDNTIENDAIIVGNVITISEEAAINRDLIVFANEVRIYGKVNRNVKIYAETVKIVGAEILADTYIKASNINIDSETKILGKLSYNKDANTKIDDAQIEETSIYENENDDTFKDVILGNAISYTGMLVVFLFLALLFPKIFEKMQTEMDKATMVTPFKLFVLGFFSLIIVPILVILLFTSTIGLTLGFLILALYIISICIINVFISYIVGRLILIKLLKREENVLLNGFVGMVVLYVLSLIPYINTLVTFVTLFIGLGIIIYLIKPSKITI